MIGELLNVQNIYLEYDKAKKEYDRSIANWKSIKECPDTKVFTTESQILEYEKEINDIKLQKAMAFKAINEAESKYYDMKRRLLSSISHEKIWYKVRDGYVMKETFELNGEEVTELGFDLDERRR